MKKNKPPKPKFTWGLCLIFCVFIFSNVQAKADQASDRDDEYVLVDDPQNQLVEVQQKFTSVDPYLVRRGDYAFWIGFDYTTFDFSNYTSVIDDVELSTGFGDTKVSLMGLELGIKRNVGPISAVGFFSYGGGSLASSGNVASSRNLDMIKYELGVKILLDGIGLSQYLVPYAGMSAYKLNLSETDSAATHGIADDTQIATKLNFGILVPLSFLDRDSASLAYMESGLENTYLDIYLTKLAETGASGDPDTSTDFTLGAGLRLEF